jgi:hypothetical protein
MHSVTYTGTAEEIAEIAKKVAAPVMASTQTLSSNPIIDWVENMPKDLKNLGVKLEIPYEKYVSLIRAIRQQAMATGGTPNLKEEKRFCDINFVRNRSGNRDWEQNKS